VHVTEGSSSTRHVREARHASGRRERTQRMEKEGVVPPRRRGARGRRADVEHQSKQHEQEYDEMDVEQLEEEELQAMDDDMEDARPQRRRTRKKHVVDPDPLDDYPSGPHYTSRLWMYQVHVAKKASEGEVFINVKLTLICC